MTNPYLPPEKHEYDENCPHCRPSFLDMTTGQVLPPDHPTMVRVFEIWDGMPFEVRKGFINVTLHNSRTPEDIRLAKQFFTALSEQVAETKDNFVKGV